MRLELNGKRLWQAVGSSRNPKFFAPKVAPGESFQEALNQATKPNTGFFAQTPLPEYLVIPTDVSELGISKLDSTGVHDQSKSDERKRSIPTFEPTV